MKENKAMAGILRRIFRLLILFLSFVVVCGLPLMTQSPLPAFLFCAGAGTFLLSSFIASQFLLNLPYRSRQDRLRGWLAFTSWMFNLHGASFLVENVMPRRTIPGGLGLMPGIILVDGRSVAVTMKYARRHRALSAGLHFTQFGEEVTTEIEGTKPPKVRGIVDLRRQFRFQPLRAQTRDGLFVRIGVYAIFQIDREPGAELDDKRFFRFYEQAVHRAVMAERVGDNPKESFDWTTVPTRLARDAALQVISTYTLDELYAPREDNHKFSPAKMRKQISAEIGEAVREQLRDYGIQLLVAGVSKIMPDDSRVTEQRVTNWRARHQRVVEAAKAAAQASVERQIEETQSDTQRRMLIRILDGMQAAPPQSYDSLLQLHLIAALEAMLLNTPVELPAETASKSGSEAETR